MWTFGSTTVRAILALVAILPFVSSACAQKRVALVVGIDTYDNLRPSSQLNKARGDAESVATALRDIGFAVIHKTDTSRAAFNAAWQEFLDTLEPGDTAAFYFAGHGVELGGRNYLLPRDVPNIKPGRDELLRRESLSVQEFLADLREKKTRLNLVILDACRDNPFERASGRSVGGARGLAGMEEPAQGTFIMYSAATGESALDRLSDTDSNRNSVYTRHLLPLIKSSGLTLTDIAEQVRVGVNKTAWTVKHQQTPAYYNQVLGKVCLTNCETLAPAPAAVVTSTASALDKIMDACVKEPVHPASAEIASRIANELAPNGQLASPMEYGWTELPSNTTANTSTDVSTREILILRISVFNDDLKIFYDLQNGYLRLRAIAPLQTKRRGLAASRFHGIWVQDNGYGCAELQVDATGEAKGRWGIHTNALDSDIFIRHKTTAADKPRLETVNAATVAPSGKPETPANLPLQSQVESKPPLPPSAPVHECDRLAATFYTAVKGVEWFDIHDIDAGSAVPACRAAVAAHPDEARFKVQLAVSLAQTTGNKSQLMAECLELLTKAADQGYVPGMAFLGTFMTEGEGEGSDPVKGREWLDKASVKGSAIAMIVLAEILQDHSKAHELYGKAAALGDANGFLGLAELFATGAGVPMDAAKALDFMQQASARGSPRAMNILGNIYDGMRGMDFGVPQDHAKALEWYQRSASRGNTSAMSSLGLAYQYGSGTPVDEVKAREWYEKAAARGHRMSMTSLGDLFAKEDGSLKDLFTARAWYAKAAALDLGDAMQKLAEFYDKGQGGPQDLAKAREWYEKAAGKDERKAMRGLALLLDQGKGGAADPKGAAKWLLEGVRKGDYDIKSDLSGTAALVSEATRKALQQQLKESGDYKGAVDGKWGNSSQAAAKAYWERK